MAEDQGGASPEDADSRNQRKIDKKTGMARRMIEGAKSLFAGAGEGGGRIPMGTGPANRHGMPKLPVGQHSVKTWPVLDLSGPPELDMAAWRLVVDGACEAPFTLTWEEFQALPRVEDVSDFHCVTTWSFMDSRWVGVRFSELAARARPTADARFVETEGYDKIPGTEQGYTTNLPLAEAMKPDVLLVDTWNGIPLPAEHGGPCRMITPQLYAWKGAKWIRRITFLTEDRPGFWEERGYSMVGDPWQDDRTRPDL